MVGVGVRHSWNRAQPFNGVLESEGKHISRFVWAKRLKVQNGT